MYIIFDYEFKDENKEKKIVGFMLTLQFFFAYKIISVYK